MLGTRRDVSARRQQEQQQRLAATVFEAASEGIFILDPDYRVLAVNRAFSAVTGYSSEEVVGRTGDPPDRQPRDAQAIPDDPPGTGQQWHLAG
jgi:PAS domain-containing protein